MTEECYTEFVTFRMHGKKKKKKKKSADNILK